MKVELEIDSRKIDVSQIQQKVSPILDSVKQQGLNVNEFEIDSGSGDASQTMQKVSSIVNTIKQQGLSVTEVEIGED
jgi:hypothetical protein